MKKEKILYVDDEKANLFNFSVSFRDHYAILTAFSGDEALAVFQSNPDIAVVVADQRMPGMSGVELLSRIREVAPNVVRIILTAYTDIPDIIDAINRGYIYHYLIKPWDEQELFHLLGKAVETHRLLRENTRLVAELETKNQELERDIAKRKKIESMLLRRDMVLAAVTGMAGALLLDRDWQLYIEELMGRMGLVMGLSRIQVYCADEDGNGELIARPLFRWIAAEGVPAAVKERVPSQVHCKKDGFDQWFVVLSDNQMISGNVADFPPGQKEFLDSYFVRSIAVAPIMVNEGLWGCVSFEDCMNEREWPAPELDALHTAGRLIGSAISREKTEKDLSAQQAQLAHSGRLNALGEMASGIGHEIHQPLTVISLGAETCKSYFERHDPNCSAAEAADEIRINVKKIANIINSMRSFSRSTSGGWKKIILADPLREALIFFREQFRMHGIEFEENISNNLPLVKTDAQKFEQVAVNFLSNARYAVDRKKIWKSGVQKKIIVSLYVEHLSADDPKRLDFVKNEEKGNQVIVFQVEDNGIGMNSETKKRCLEPFFTTKEVGEGTGLGLSVTYNIIRELNFHLDIHSQEGEGALFRVLIPVAKEDCI